MSRVCCSLHLFAAAQRSMSVYEEQDLLLKLQDSLLQTGDAEKIRVVMRFSGSRMIIYHPVIVIRHVMETWKERAALRQIE